MSRLDPVVDCSVIVMLLDDLYFPELIDKKKKEKKREFNPFFPENNH